MAKIATAGNQEIAIRHFTTDITQLPYWMDSNCYIVFSLLWRRYISNSINDKLITQDGWFQYTMKSLKDHAGFKDKGTLHRTVEGLYRSGLIDVRVVDGSRMWACWRMNKDKIESVASIPDRDAMQDPYINSINTISSSDKNFTYQLNKEGIEELMKYFMVTPVENPPLFNTITQQDVNTSSHKHITTSSLENSNSKKPHNCNTTLSEDNSEDVPNRKMDYGIRDKELEKEMEAPAEKDTSENKDKGDSEWKSKNEIETEENPNEYQSLDKKPSEGNQASISSELREEGSNIDSSSPVHSNDEDSEQPGENDSSSSKPQLTEEQEFNHWKELIAPELEKMKHAISKEHFNQLKKQFYQFLKGKVNETGFINEGAWEQLKSYIRDFMSTWEYNTIERCK